MERINIVILGAGDIAIKRHIPAILKSDYTNLRGILNRHPESTKAVAARYQVKAYSDLEEVLADPEVHAVLISTPPGQHTELAIEALNRGKHVLLEKPMALSTEEAIRINEAARASGRKLELLRVQLLTIRSVLGNKDPELLQGKAYPGWEDALHNIGVHRADLMRWLTGSEAQGVYAHVSRILSETRPGEQRETNDHVAGIIQYENGVVGTLVASRLSFHGEDRSTTLIGTKGAIITFSEGHDLVLKLSDGTVQYFDFEQTHPQEVLELTDLHERFARSILEDTPVDVTGEDGIESVRIIEAFEKANAEKRYQILR